MGYQRRVHGDCTEYIQTSNMYKIAIVVCLAAAVSAEADADAALLYGAYGYTGLAGAYPYAYGAYPYAYGGYGVTNAANTVGIAGVAPAALPAVAGGYAGAGRYVANSAGVVHVAKRSADAEPEAEADAALLYEAYGYGGYGLGYAGYGYGAYPYALDTPMVVTHMPMVPTTERDLLMPSQKLMLPTCMELMDMVDTVLDTDLTDMDTHMLMVDMDTHMPMESKL